MKHIVIEAFRPFAVISAVAIGICIIRQIWKIKKEQPQNHQEMHLLLLELGLLIISMLAFIQKDITLFFSFYVE